MRRRPPAKRGRKPRSALEQARRAAAERPLPPVDGGALAAQLTDEGPRRRLLERMIAGLLEVEEAARVQVLAGSAVAVRALNETRRLLAQLTGLDDRPPAPPALPPGEVDVPEWVPLLPPGDGEALPDLDDDERAPPPPPAGDDADLDRLIAGILSASDEPHGA